MCSLRRADFHPYEERTLISEFGTKELAVVVQSEAGSIGEAEEAGGGDSGDSLLAIRSAILDADRKLIRCVMALRDKVGTHCESGERRTRIVLKVVEYLR